MDELIFLSTPSGWRATIKDYNGNTIDFISIHALRVEGDFAAAGCSEADKVFLSTPSGWRATEPNAKEFPAVSDFYPRPPGGGRRLKTDRSC